jgi:pimeloyl-ACP methyl ester carboxylesterase
MSLLHKIENFVLSRVSGTSHTSCLEELYRLQPEAEEASTASNATGEVAVGGGAAGSSRLSAAAAGTAAIARGDIAPAAPPTWPASEHRQWRRRERRRVLRSAFGRGAARLWPLWTHIVLPATFLVLQPVAVAALRILVRKKAFWEKGLKSAYFDASTLTPELLYRYRLPALVQGWEAGIWRFVRARIGGDIEIKGQHKGEGTALLDQFKAALVSAEEASGHKVPVLILHGEQDGLIPIGNSCRLAAVLDATLVKVSDCGHTPAEEVPACFVHEVERFVEHVRATR